MIKIIICLNWLIPLACQKASLLRILFFRLLLGEVFRTDAEWIADLVRHGLVKASYIPNRNQRELREITRYRQEIIEERARELNRIQSVLEGCNIKLSSVITDISGKSGMSILKAIISGETDPVKLSELTEGRARHKLEELQKALQGRIMEHQQKMLQHQVNHIESLTFLIQNLDEDIKKKQNR